MKIIFTALTLVSLTGCYYFETVENRQLRVCADDIRLALDNPDSFELLSSKHINLEKGHRVSINYRAKNKQGQQVQREDSCGFLSATGTDLDSQDFFNLVRALYRALK